MSTNDKLQSLRERYQDAGGADIYDPEFRRAASAIFSQGHRPAPYSGISTFLGADYRPDAADQPGFGGLDVALIGVPMDLGVTNRSGSRFGPRAVRDIDRVGPYQHVLKTVPLVDCKVADIGDVPFSARFSLEQSTADIETYFKKVVAQGVIPLSVGGDHSISYPILKAVGQGGPVGMIHIDAHCDTAGQFEGQKFHHGGPFRSAVLDGVLDPERTVQIGIRGATEYLWEFSYESGMTVIHAEELHRMGVDAVIEQARSIVGDGPTYISFDVDALDPSIAPGTGTPELGGLSTREAIMLLNGFEGLNIVGGDVVEVAPQYDATTNTAQVGAQMLFEILSLIATSPKFRTQRD
jgi:agmatinase